MSKYVRSGSKSATKLHDMEIVLDTMKDLGEFIEVGKIVTNENPEDRKKIQQEIAGFIETLGIAQEDLLINSKYDIMLFEKRHKKKFHEENY